MVEPEAVAAMLQLKGLGWGSKRLAGKVQGASGTIRRVETASSLVWENSTLFHWSYLMHGG